MSKQLDQAFKEALGGLVFDLVVSNNKLETAMEQVKQLEAQIPKDTDPKPTNQKE